MQVNLNLPDDVKTKNAGRDANKTSRLNDCSESESIAAIFTGNGMQVHRHEDTADGTPQQIYMPFLETVALSTYYA